MSQASPTTSSQPAPAASSKVPTLHNPLKVVLFGMPAAGKSSLLGALMQAAQTQPGTLRANLIDHTGGLAECRRRLYEDRPVRTAQEILTFPVTLQSLPQADGSAGPPSQDVLLVDCDGQVVNTMLMNQSLTGSGKGELQQAVLDADALILVVDISMPENLKKDFASFARFLRVLEHSRSARNELNGLPVFLVLSKCDLLAKANDTTTTWMERIEETKRQVDRKFREFLAQQAAREHQPFGKIDLRVWATATGRPALGGAPPRPQEPYQVAELFRMTLEAARQFRALRARASRKLGLAVGAITAFLGLLLLVGVIFLALRPSAQATALESEVEALRSSWSRAPLEHYQDPQEKLKNLHRLEDHSEFQDLPETLRGFVKKTRQELEAYQKYTREFKERVLREPRFTQNFTELNELEKTLKDLTPPPQYEAVWRLTAVGKRRELYLREAEQFRQAINQTAKQLEQFLERAKKLDDPNMTVGQYREQKEALLKESERLLKQFGRENQLAYVRDHSFTYADLARFDLVADLLERWREKDAELRSK